MLQHGCGKNNRIVEELGTARRDGVRLVSITGRGRDLAKDWLEGNSLYMGGTLGIVGTKG